MAWAAADMVPQGKVPDPHTALAGTHYLTVQGQLVHKTVVVAGHIHTVGSFGRAEGILPAGTAVESKQLVLQTLAVRTPDADKDLADSLLARMAAVKALPGS